MIRILLIIITFFLSFQHLSGSTSHYSYTQLSLAEGLSQASVQAILLDSKGNLWIGTKNGLNLYARQKMTNFFHTLEDRHSIPNNQIIHLAEDSLGNIWIATSQGLALYNKERNVFDTYTRSRIQSSLCIEGGILFGGDNAIYFYNYQTRQLEHRTRLQPEGPQTLPIQYRVEKMIPMEEKKIMVATRRKGVYIYHYETGLFEPYITDYPNPLLIAICRTSDHRIFASFFGQGVHYYDAEGRKLGSYTTENSPLTNNYVMDLLEHDGKLWLATDGGGINLVDVENGEFSFLSHITGDSSSLPVNSIIRLYKDYHENLWIGSVRGGAINVKDSYIRTYQDVVFHHSGGLTEKSVTGLYEEEDGRLWIGTDGGGVNLYDPKTDKFTHFPTTYGDKVISMTNLSETELLISIYTKGLFVFNKHTGKYTRFLVKDANTDRKVCYSGYVTWMSGVGKEKIYIIGNGGWIYHIPTRKFTPICLPDGYADRTSPLQMAYSDDEFSLLKQGNVIFMADVQTDSVKVLVEAPADENITSLTYDRQRQTVWVGTDRGLRYFNLNEKEYQNFHTALFSSVSYLTIDGKDRLWISAQNKLFSYSISADKFTFWNNSDGYLPNEIQSKYHKTRNKDFIYLGGAEGLVKIATDISAGQEDMPEIFLSDVHYNGKSYLNHIEANRFEIPWDYQSVMLTFGVKCEDVFQKYLLKYIIRSSSGEHTFESYEPQLNLSSLSPGEYSIIVSCYTKDGSESPASQLLTLVVTPPWYKSIWFITLLVILLLGGIAGLWHWLYLKKTRQMKGDVGEFLQTVLQTLDTKDELADGIPSAPASLEEVPLSAPVLSEADKAFLAKMDRLINDNLSNDELSAKFLIDHLAMSRASLYNKVKLLTGMGVNDYINRIRIERSVHLLTTTDMSINDISQEVGFSYPRYFSTSFKQVKGMTPTRFKEENRKKIQNEGQEV
jgi:ligand-binding sensor domain-containing protein/AraC-like DNA-binding protein